MPIRIVRHVNPNGQLWRHCARQPIAGGSTARRIGRTLAPTRRVKYAVPAASTPGCSRWPGSGPGHLHPPFWCTPCWWAL
jgi:hypothetical protein